MIHDTFPQDDRGQVRALCGTRHSFMLINSLRDPCRSVCTISQMVTVSTSVYIATASPKRVLGHTSNLPKVIYSLQAYLQNDFSIPCLGCIVHFILQHRSPTTGRHKSTKSKMIHTRQRPTIRQ